ncbi:MAG: hypothetical protein QF752_09645 [Planctomycetota bacterium]|nr:hypothetical protein [Planctomycetota bacterium]
MYESCWKFEGKPFSTSPDLERFFYSEAHESVMLSLLHAIDRELGLTFLEGPSGVGKTFLIRVLASRLSDRGFRVARVGASGIDRKEFAQTALGAFSKNEPALSVGGPWSQLEDLIPQWREEGGRGLLLIVDSVDASVEAGVWGVMRQYLDLNGCYGLPVHLLLVGRVGLQESSFAGSGLEARMGCRCRLAELSLQDTASYLRFCLKRAGGREDLFDRGAIEELHRHSEGIPLRINHLADRSLWIAAQRGGTRVDSRIVDASLDPLGAGEVFQECSQESHDLLAIHQELLEGRERRATHSTDNEIEQVRDPAKTLSEKEELSGGVVQDSVSVEGPQERRADPVDSFSEGGVVESNGAKPDGAEPKVDESEMDEPEVVESEVAEPKVDESEVDEPEVVESEVVESEVAESEVGESEVNESEVDLAERSLDEILDGLLPEETEEVLADPEPSFPGKVPEIAVESSSWVSREVPTPTLQISEAGQRQREEGGRRQVQSIDGISQRESHDLQDCVEEDDSAVLRLGGVLGRLFGSAE